MTILLYIRIFLLLSFTQFYKVSLLNFCEIDNYSLHTGDAIYQQTFNMNSGSRSSTQTSVLKSY